MVRCFEAAGGDANDRFAADFNCLSFPISLWTNIASVVGILAYFLGISKMDASANSLSERHFAETFVRTSWEWSTGS